MRIHQVTAAGLGGLFATLQFEGGAVAVDIAPLGPGTTEDIVAVGPDTDNSGRIHVYERFGSTYVRSHDLAVDKDVLPVDVAVGRVTDDERDEPRASWGGNSQRRFGSKG